jgi:hypothetical protein
LLSRGHQERRVTRFIVPDLSFAAPAASGHVDFPTRYVDVDSAHPVSTLASATETAASSIAATE